MSELKTLANCKPSEFLKQTNRLKKSVEKWLTETDIVNIRKKVPALEPVPIDATVETKAEIFAINKKRMEEQARKNVSEMLDAILELHPDETLEVLALCCFIEPKDIDNYTMRDLLIPINSLLNDEAVIDFFTSLASLGQTITSEASKA